MKKKTVKRLRLRKEVKNVLYYLLVMFGFIALLLLINVIENLNF